MSVEAGPAVTDRRYRLGATVSHSAFRPVDTSPPPAHGPSVSKKPHKIEEPKAAYPAKKPAKAALAQTGPRFADLEKVRANNAKLIQIHAKVLQKLAQ